MNSWLNNLSRFWKRFILLLAILALVGIAQMISWWLRFGGIYVPGISSGLWVMLGIMQLSAFILVFSMNVHGIKVNSLGNRSIVYLGAFSGILGLIGVAANFSFDLGVPRTIPLIFSFVLFFLLSTMFLGGNAVLKWLRMQTYSVSPVAVYGAGAAGIQLISALEESREIKPAAIVDDSSNLQGVIISGLTVKSPSCLADMVKSGKIKKVLLAMPSVSPQKKQKIIASLSQLGCEVQSLPSYIDLISGEGLLESLQPVQMEDLLGREGIDINIPGVANAYKSRVVMVTGAGGSIGSELCRQILTAEPHKLVLFEMTEHALYTIDRELGMLAQDSGIEVVPVLGSVTDAKLVAETMKEHGVNLVLHAAAYKHVPLIEAHVLEGVRNNVLGTKAVAEAALAANIERFILISTDKAVRPTNIMGATKRLSELVIQDIQTRSKGTRFAMVRFGNVLDSSGSVIPLFREQIAAGGPITLTHNDVTRYFMTIPEASRLVLLAGSFSEGGDVFVLDMGKPVRIADMARRLIELSGLTVRDEANPEGNIEIITTGMRPGEKLYEELLIGENILPTPHKKILRAEEHMLSQLEMADALRGLEQALDTRDVEAARRLIARWVKGYHSVDYGDVA
ncbi:MAG: polysaccharide biosynthesis protein [Rhodobacteraceae bacterium]|nr:polysaccharide biosynthesis protein [Paracoccaceae bacterium]